MPTVKVNDINLYYEIHGDGEPICLIPGLNNTITDYKKIIHLLSRDYKVIVLENRGVGRTDKPDSPYSISVMSEDVAELLRYLDIDKAHILGVSLGGRIATELTLEHPDQVKSLILTSTYVHQITSELSNWRLAILLRFSRLRKPHHGILHQRDAARNYDATKRLHEIEVPTLILHGRKDKFAPYRFAEEMHNTIRNSKIVTFSGGHLFLFFRPERFVSAIAEFLGGLRR